MKHEIQETNLGFESGFISRRQKEKLNKQKAFVIWLTGLSGAGKSTIARNLEASLFENGIRTLILDGDNTRMTINHDLDFSAEGRHENIRRVAEIAKLLNDAGVVVITAFISPFREDRIMAREMIGEDCFIEVFVDTPLELCIQRDTKGLYKKALKGGLKDFTGISSPYDLPEKPDIHVETKGCAPEETVQQIVDWLSKEKLIGQVKL
ncbi:MAG: adenylyl-sulfate kinase [Bacteroidales bacterium]|nr:adenylyl-sulfate kinase [Bacteroidales bacterium]